MEHHCYILFNDVNNKTYVGYTTNLQRRIRQHNGEIKGGAKYTLSQINKQDIVWSYLVTVSCATWDNSKALSCEWHVKHVKDASLLGSGAFKRLHALYLVLNKDAFKDYHFVVHVAPNYFDHVQSKFREMNNVCVEKL
jgi:predicted GIY-YIG superfamily endonuclease